jgi:hypothetical protein
MQEDDTDDGDLFKSKCRTITCTKGVQEDARDICLLNYFTTAPRNV